MQTKNKRLAQQQANKIYSKYEQILNMVRLFPSEQIQELTDNFILNQLVQEQAIKLTINIPSQPAEPMIKSITITEAYQKFCTHGKLLL